jgi:enediyne polyketide synthase
MTRIAIVGLACRYPDADSPEQLWTNVLAGRRAFRRLPDERMRLADYWSPDPAAPDRFYARQAAVIQGYQFDRVGYRVAGSTYRSTDLTHWLALDVATRALADAGFPNGDELPRERTTVVVGNTLTGEFARANLMRLRWPYVQRTLAAALRDEGWDDEQLARFLAGFEERYKRPFPPIDEDTLAGGLSNTIAGRICNYFDLKGGGYTVDGACSSSLLSVATACRSLRDQEADVAIAGGVDLSIDPFEIIGFAKTGALATGEMRVYDRGSSGFWPGEGCGMVVLMREADAQAVGRRSYATIAGCGVSSDGKGGITRPEVTGYRLALHRAYRQAGFGVDTVGLFEGHGTGTPVGNDTELTALSTARRAADRAAPPAVIGSIKAMIGHTKAAAGVAGLIKAALAVHHEVLPPTVGCDDPHPLLCEEQPALRVLPMAEPWPPDVPVRAGVMAMGFGGINTHVVVENPNPRRRGGLLAPVAAVSRLAAGQGAELLVCDEDDAEQLRHRVAELADFVGRLSYAEIGDLAATLRRQVAYRSHRAAVVAGSPEEAEQRLHRLARELERPPGRLLDPENGIFASSSGDPGRIGFLFPGQGSGNQLGGGALCRRFPPAEQVFAQTVLPAGADLVATAVAQPRIAAGSLAGLAVLTWLGIDATVAVGHSLGELCALHWAGSLDEAATLRIAGVRGRVMTEHSDPGTMASIAAAPEAVEALLAGAEVVVAGYNGPLQTVVAGPAVGVERVCARAAAAGLDWVLLPVSHAFHSPLVARGAAVLADHLATERPGAVARRVISTVTGAPLAPDTDLAALLTRQVTAPVQFGQAVATAAQEVDLFLEIGPGAVLSRLAIAATGLPAIPIDTDNRSLAPLWNAVAAAYVTGTRVRFEALSEGRPDRPLAVGAELSFFASPCEAAPAEPAAWATVVAQPELSAQAAVGPGEPAAAGDAETIELVRDLVAARAELPTDAVQEGSRLLDDLHLSSITVGQVFVQAAQKLGLPAGQAPTSFATATLKELAAALDDLRTTSRDTDREPPVAVAGVDSWVRPFAIAWVPVPEPAGDSTVADQSGPWRVYARDDHPLAEPLRRALDRGGVGGGVLVCLPAGCQEPDLELALLAAKAAVGQQPPGRLVMVQDGRGAAAIAKTARLEAPQLRTTVIDTPLVESAVARIVVDVAATTGYREVRYGARGDRQIPVLRPLLPQPAGPPMTGADVLLVTGGGKGITAECAIALAADSGARLAILGRSDPDTDQELAANLARMSAAGLTAGYWTADVTDRAAVRAAVHDIAATWGPVTALLHGAGSNQPAALTDLDMAAFRRTMAPKLDGLAAVLAAVDPAGLRLVVTFGSIIGRAGLRGEAHYATANDWLALATAAISQQHPHCRAICLEWSVWAGVGMGERLSVIASLVRDGITPITVDRGIEVLRQLVADPSLPPVVVVTGRADGVDTIGYDRPPLPLLRFCEKPLIHYPGVELVVETRLSAASDPYLADHLLDGNLLFPAVLGMEAMAQVATALRGRPEPPSFERVEFARPIVVPPDGETVIRVAALVTGPAAMTVAIRCGDTGFGADHFRAELRFGRAAAPDGVPEPVAADLPPVPLEPARDLYGDLLFQSGRFQRLTRYLRMAARHAEAEVEARDEQWFASYLPGELTLGDPGSRDAFMHGLQVCVPDATLLPAAIERLHVDVAARARCEQLRFAAVERSHDGDTYVYDIAVHAPDGTLVERWDGLRLQAVRKTGGDRAWPAALLGPFLQRRFSDLLAVPLLIAVEPDPPAGAATGGRQRTALAVSRALNHQVDVHYRPDGRPEVAGELRVSASHGAGVTMAIAGRAAVGCDVEPVAARPPGEWYELLRPHGPVLELLAGSDGDPYDLAATRIWCALEALQKVGELRDSPLVVTSRPADGWVLFRSGGSRVGTLVTSLTGAGSPVVFAVAVREGG